MLFGQGGSYEADGGVSVLRDTYDIGASAHLHVESLVGTVGPDLAPFRVVEGGGGQDVSESCVRVVVDSGMLSATEGRSRSSWAWMSSGSIWVHTLT